MSLEFLQKSDIHVQNSPVGEGHLEGKLNRVSETVGVDLACEELDDKKDHRDRGPTQSRSSCSQKSSLVSRSPFSSSMDPSGGTRQHQYGGNFFARTFAVALDQHGNGKSHSRRSMRLPSFLRGDQSASVRLLPSLRLHQHRHHVQPAAPTSSPSSPHNELTAKSLPQVNDTISQASTAPLMTKAPRRGACSSAGDAHYLACPQSLSTAAFSASVSSTAATRSYRGQPLSVGTQNGAATRITASGSSPIFSYSPPPPPSNNTFI